MSELTIAQKIEKELAGKKCDEIEVLDFTGCTGESFEGLTEKFCNLEEIIASGCGLKSCDGLPPLKSLQKLDISDNCITDLKAVAALPSLQMLDISNNNIDKLEVIESLYGAPKLECIILEGNEVKQTEGFMELLFTRFPFLVSIDGINNPNGSTFYENGEDYEEYDSEASDESDSDEEVGINALQESGDLEEDEEDYEPGEDEDGYDDEEDECDDEDEAEPNHVEKAGAKRKAEDVEESGDAKRVSSNGTDK